MQLKFEEKPLHITNTQITVRSWVAEPTPNDAFNIVCLKHSDLENMRTGRVNFIGDTKPRAGTLEELTDVYLCSWMHNEEGAMRTRPLVGNFNGGFASHRGAVQMCVDVWRRRWKYRKPREQIMRVPPMAGLH